jgi:polyisoprenoid-binding protein YceI
MPKVPSGLMLEKYPFITYKSSQILKTQSGYMVRGTLTIRNISKPVTIPFKFNPKGKISFF